jgi:hypothetical protein
VAGGGISMFWGTVPKFLKAAFLFLILKQFELFGSIPDIFMGRLINLLVDWPLNIFIDLYDGRFFGQYSAI